MSVQEEMERDEKLLKIAKKHLDLTTLESRKMDRLDFKEQGVVSVKAALLAAYEAGYKEGFSIGHGCGANSITPA